MWYSWLARNKRRHTTFSNDHLHAHLVTISAKLDNVLSMLRDFSIRSTKTEKKLMADAASILAKITANNDLIRSQTEALVALSEGQADITTEIQNLKDQIAAGQNPDFGPLDTAADEQTKLVEGAGKAIKANTTAKG